ncbi:MAG TPA: saccharopine dehydrogenase C-terminal domain-containing protein [Phycisphaerales bacterium]|nr:saccharopine dehydrogenase C-terminal domain-containing protein [Phycisphaerales bacterium]HRQ75460.1 saccharopine dehydrogenase C-terminal domain-containing protein [Phycisphaerales bacterium]
MQKAIVLGGGMVGSVMATDLAASGIRTTLADRSPAALKKAAERLGAGVSTLEADLSDARAVMKLVEPFDIVLGALPSAIGFQTLRTVIEAGKPYCDISFMPENALELDALAKARGVTAVVDCGVAPGMSNMAAGYAHAQLDRCESIVIYVGGLPRERRWPFEYKAGFSPHDVIEEYTRPSRIVEYGKVVIREALSEPELIDFAGVGTLEAFNTDGLRSIADTLDAPFMKEKTLRYPGHIELMRVFRETGLFGTEPIQIGGVSVVPRDVIASLMFPKWTYQPGEEDLTVMRIVVEGVKAGQRTRYSWDLLDYFDRASMSTSMSRTTALPCTIVARMILAGQIRQVGVLPPELIGNQEGCLHFVMSELEGRGVHYASRVEDLGRAD